MYLWYSRTYPRVRAMSSRYSCCGLASAIVSLSVVGAEDRPDLCVIGIGRQLLGGPGPELEARVTDRRLGAQLARQRDRRPDVLEHQPEAEAGVVGLAQDVLGDL